MYRRDCVQCGGKRGNEKPRRGAGFSGMLLVFLRRRWTSKWCQERTRRKGQKSIWDKVCAIFYFSCYSQSYSQIDTVPETPSSNSIFCVQKGGAGRKGYLVRLFCPPGMPTLCAFSGRNQSDTAVEHLLAFRHNQMRRQQGNLEIQVVHFLFIKDRTVRDAHMAIFVLGCWEYLCA